MIIFACKFCAILLTSSSQTLLADSVQFVNISDYRCNCAILSMSSQIVLHVLAISVQFY